MSRLQGCVICPRPAREGDLASQSTSHAGWRASVEPIWRGVPDGYHRWPGEYFTAGGSSLAFPARTSRFSHNRSGGLAGWRNLLSSRPSYPGGFPGRQRALAGTAGCG
jgi:hypothetical protein